MNRPAPRIAASGRFANLSPRNYGRFPVDISFDRRDRIMRRLLIAALSLAMVAAAGGGVTQSAWAQSGTGDSANGVTRQGPADDEVILVLEVEEWVETQSATVRLQADLAVAAGTFGAARADLLETLDGFGIDARWRVVDFAKQRDDAGFERWSVTSEARVPEAALADLSAKAEAATKPGRALRVAEVDYSPTLAEREAVSDQLRGRLYSRIAAEIASLNQAFEDRSFRVRMIDFTPSIRPQPRFETMPRAAALQSGGPAPRAAALTAAEKAVLTARVHLAASVPDE